MVFDFDGYAFLVLFYIGYTAMYAVAGIGMYYLIRGRLAHDEKEANPSMQLV